MGHSCGTLLWDTLVGNSTCGILLSDTLVGHSCRTLLWDTPVGHTIRMRLPPKVTLRGCKTSVSFETSSKSHASSLKNERFVRDFLQKVTRQVSKTSVSYETSSKSHMSSPQNERFVRDFLKNSHVKVCKMNVSHETSSKSPAETPIGAHITQPSAKQFRDSSPSKQHPLTRQSQCDSDIHLYHNSQPHDSLRLPRIFPHPHV